MRKQVLTFFFILAAVLSGFASTATITGTVTDSTTQVIANGTITATLYTVGLQPPFVITGTSTPVTQVVTGTLDSSGVFSIIVNTNPTISPAGTQWTFKVCTPFTNPKSCTSYTVAVSGNVNIGTQLSGNFDTITTSSFIPPQGYTDAEVLSPVSSSIYYNWISGKHRFYNGTVWANIGGTSGGTPGAPDTSVQFNNGGSFGGSVNFQWLNTEQTLKVVGDAALSVNDFSSTLYVESDSADTTNTVPVVAGQFYSNATNATGRTLDIFGITATADQSGNGGVDDMWGARIKARSLGSGPANSVTGVEATAGTKSNTPAIAGLKAYWSAEGVTTTVAAAYGLWLSLPSVSDATVTNAYGVYVDPIHQLGTVNTYALRIADQGAGANDYAIKVDGGKVDLTAATPLMPGGSSGKAICWKTATTLGFCSTVVGADGSCTCN